MTIYDISKQAGVSIATVSRVLNGSENVKPKTRKKVLDIIEQCGYTPNVFARGLGLNSMKTVGILCADSSDIYLAKAVYHIERNLKTAGYHSILNCTGYDLAHKKEGLSLLLNQRVDSIIMVGSNFISENEKDNHYIRDAAKQVPVMLLNGDLDCENVFCTMCDDYKSMKEVTGRLLSQKIHDILFLYHSKTYSSMKKLAGYQAAYVSMDLPLSKDLTCFFNGSHEDIDGVCDYLCNLHDKGLRFRAVVAADDMLAVGAVKYARKMNLRIPQDIKIVGYNNSILSVCSEPKLTTVDNHLELLCSQLVKTCICTLGGTSQPTKTIFSGEIILRESANL